MTLFRRVAARLKPFWRRLRGAGSPLELGVSVAVGLFIGCLPLYGLHLLLCLLVCLPLRLDAVSAYLAAQVSNPWVAPFLLALEARIGGKLLGRSSLTLEDFEPGRLGDFFERTLVGSLVVGFSLALVGGVLTLLVARAVDARRPSTEALRRTLERYRAQPPADRWYVDLKLRTDPVVPALLALGPLGRVIDAGAGRGQMGLFLWDSGRVTRLFGFDSDARKVRLAASAAGSDARYEVSDLSAYAPPAESADSVLLIDVLHYLSRAEQDAALASVAEWLVPGGRLIVREADERSKLRSAITRAAERIAVATGYNRAQRRLEFRPLREFCALLERLGFDCVSTDASAGTPFANALLVATRRANEPLGRRPPESPRAP